MNTVLIDEKSSDGQLKITITANRELKSIEISDELLKDKEQLEDYLILTLNKAIQKQQTLMMLKWLPLPAKECQRFLEWICSRVYYL